MESISIESFMYACAILVIIEMRKWGGTFRSPFILMYVAGTSAAAPVRNNMREYVQMMSTNLQASKLHAFSIR